jgi:hypothetical protein
MSEAFPDRIVRRYFPEGMESTVPQPAPVPKPAPKPKKTK